MQTTIDWNALDEISPLLAALPRSLRQLAKRTTLKKSGLLFSRGDRPRAMYFVMRGEVHLVRQSPAGGLIVLQRGRHGFIAEASLDQASYHCDATAIVTSDILMLPRKAFLEALSDERIRGLWISHLARELRRVRAQAERLSLKTVQERIVHYMETEGDGGRVRLSQSKKDWAAELGVTHEALYRALAQMARGRVIVVEGATISFAR